MPSFGLQSRNFEACDLQFLNDTFAPARMHPNFGVPIRVLCIQLVMFPQPDANPPILRFEQGGLIGMGYNHVRLHFDRFGEC